MKKERQSRHAISNMSIFGEYKQDENRVTAALLHILYIGGDPIIQRVFGDTIDIPSNDIQIISQSFHEDSVPDGEIFCDCRYKIFLESKIKTNAINLTQLASHKNLQNPATNAYLCYITPDTVIPSLLSDSSIAWLSWDWVVKVLLGAVAEGITTAVLKYLIKQFCILVKHLVYKNKSTPFDFIYPDIFMSEGEDRVIIVGGSWGEDVAVKYKFYACQNHRSFLSAKYLAFCYNNRINYLFKITEIKDSINLKDAGVPDEYFKEKEPQYNGDLRKVIKLELEKTFNPVISNDKKDKNGNLCAFVQGQTYTTYNKIIKATSTSELR